MTLSKVLLFAVLFGLTACGNKSDSSGSATKPPAGKVEDASTDYVQTANLNLAGTNEDLDGIRGNSVTMKGTGTKSTYKIIYKFNSGNADSFNVIETSLHSSYSDCSAPQMKLFLKDKDQSREVSTIDQITLEPNSEYVLEAVSAPSCKDLDMTFDIIAWAGSSMTTPKVAAICEGQRIMQATFVMNVNFVTAYSSVVGKEKFLDMNTYCGESFEGASKTECSGSANIGLSSKGASLSHVQCAAVKGSERRSYSLDFDVANKSANVICKSADTKTYAESFRSCQMRIVDYKQYNR